MTYASETWTLTKALEQRLAAAQRNMERAMIGVSWQDHRRNEWIRSNTKVRDIMHVIKARKWTLAGHIARHLRWTSQVTDWRPMDGSRPRGRPWKRWRDEIDDSWRSVRRMLKRDCHGKTMLRLSSNTWIDNGLHVL